jgi:hypothetical protein
VVAREAPPDPQSAPAADGLPPVPRTAADVEGPRSPEPAPAAGSWLDRRYRLNPSFRLVRPGDIDLERFPGLRAMRLGPDYRAILLPTDVCLSAKAVTAETAALVAAFRSPGPLPTGARREFGVNTAGLQRLVLDGVLQIEDEGTFVSGADALAVLGVPVPRPRPATRPAMLSVAALRHAELLGSLDAPTLAGRLYAFNRVPASPRWRRRLRSEADVRGYMGLRPGSRTWRLLDQKWTGGVSAGKTGWVFWRSGPSPPGGSRFKLYVSPRCEHLGPALERAIPVLTEAGTPSFKIGRDLYGLLRPDKFVIYFPSLRDLRETQPSLSEALAGLEPQGVPFTAPIDGGGLISWGIDPPEAENLLPNGGTSWRRWLTERLAVALLAGRLQARADRAVEPWRFALARIGLDGVDANSWLPTGVQWESP